MPTLSIIIVNWNSGDLLRNCLHSIVTADKTNFQLAEVIVVDNASSDNSLDGLEKIDLPLKIIRNSSNRGFASACNQGFRESKGDYLLFLNPDTVLFKESLTKPIAFMESKKNTNIGIVGIQLINENNEVSRTCARFPTLGRFISKILGLDRVFPSLNHFMVEWDHKHDRIVDQVIGAFFLVRRELFEKLNGFDERFFVYFEELDFSYRAKQLGYNSYYLANVQAYHKGGGTTSKIKDVRLFYSLRSKILYGYKHFNWLSATFLAFFVLMIEPITRIVYAIAKGSFNDIIITLKAYRLLWFHIPRLISTRSKVK